MKKHHTKNKGDLGALKAQADVCSQGYTILIPLTEHAPFDFVAYKDNKFLRIQAKYRSVVKGAITVQFRSSWSDKFGPHVTPTDKSEIDMFCIYCPETDKCYYLNPDKFHKSVTLRIEESKNSQKSKVHLAENYRKID